ncbi:MAG: hypothetical protein PVI80_18550 [Anaerolineae bacterium]|jgi:hypothetical protein
MTRSKKKQAPVKERGTWLSIWLIFIMLHGILASVLIWYLRNQGGDSSPAWILAVLFVMAIVDIVAAILVWNWKRWGLWLYAISTIVGIVIGLVLTRSQLWVFHDIIPLVILGFLVKDKQSYFDKPPLGMG